MSFEVTEGAEIAGRYRVEKVLGQGGMGMVLRARHAWTGRAVALKVILPELASSSGAAARFLREAQTAASLRHPNVVDVLDMGRAEDGTLFLAMELLEGEPLSARLERLGKLTPEDAVVLLLPILDALALAHEHGLVHRDIKPDNIFLVSEAGRVRPKLLDFGIVRAFRAEDQKLTATGVVLGTPGYMAPEQIAGDPAGPTADVWAIGTILFEALSGRAPFDVGSALSWMTRVITEPVPALATIAPEVPSALAAIVDRTLLRDPAQRFADAGALAAALRGGSIDGLAATVALPSIAPGRIEAPPEAPSATLPRTHAGVAKTVSMDPPPSAPATRTLLPIGALLLSIAIACGGVIWWSQRGSSEPSPSAEGEDDRVEHAETGEGSSEAGALVEASDDEPARAEGARTTSSRAEAARAATTAERSRTEATREASTRNEPTREAPTREEPARSERGDSTRSPATSTRPETRSRESGARSPDRGEDRRVDRRAPRTTAEDM